MGLKLTLEKEHNHLYTDFIDAYWAIDNVGYTTEQVVFTLYAYPSRDAKLMHKQALEHPSIGYGSPIGAGSVNSIIYLWNVQMALTNIFPSGTIPAGRDAQYTAIYNWIKSYTGLPFEDVLENDVQ